MQTLFVNHPLCQLSKFRTMSIFKKRTYLGQCIKKKGFQMRYKSSNKSEEKNSYYRKKGTLHEDEYSSFFKNQVRKKKIFIFWNYGWVISLSHYVSCFSCKTCNIKNALWTSICENPKVFNQPEP